MKGTQDYLRDVLVYITDVETFSRDGESVFYSDRKTQLAIIRAFEVIGEIVKRLPQSLLDNYPDVDWRAVKGFRDILIHQYDNVDLNIVWQAVERVQGVKSAVLHMLANLPDDTNE